MKTPQELTVCVSLRLPITSLTEFSLPFNTGSKAGEKSDLGFVWAILHEGVSGDKES